MGGECREQFDASAEQRLLLSELDQLRCDWRMPTHVVETMLGVLAGFLDGTIVFPLPGYAEAQLRRLLEIGVLARSLMGEKSRDWLQTSQVDLACRSPIEMMQRPGGIAFVRNLLRDAFDDPDSFRPHGHLA